MDDEAQTPSPDESLVFDEIERVTGLTESYSRSAGEAAHRGDKTTLAVHLRQMRLCVTAAINAYKDFLGGGRGGI